MKSRSYALQHSVLLGEASSGRNIAPYVFERKKEAQVFLATLGRESEKRRDEKRRDLMEWRRRPYVTLGKTMVGCRLR